MANQARKAKEGSEALKSQVLRLSDLVDYLRISAASRMIIRKDTGGVALFAFDQGQGLSEHTDRKRAK